MCVCVTKAQGILEKNKKRTRWHIGFSEIEDKKKGCRPLVLKRQTHKVNNIEDFSIQNNGSFVWRNCARLNVRVNFSSFDLKMEIIAPLSEWKCRSFIAFVPNSPNEWKSMLQWCRNRHSFAFPTEREWTGNRSAWNKSHSKRKFWNFIKSFYLTLINII